MKSLIFALLLACCVFAANASVQVTVPYSVLLGSGGGSIPISVKVLNPDGEPASGIGVVIRVVDYQESGILGARKYADAMRMTDSLGIASGTLSLPPLASSGQHRDGFPFNLRIEAYAYKHDAFEDWAAQGSAIVKLESAAPIVSSIGFSPNPAQAGQSSLASIVFIDMNSGDVTVNLNSSGGSWNYSQSSISPGSGSPFGGGTKTLSIPWTVPKRGMNAQEVALARSFASQLEPITLSSASVQSSSLLSKYPSRMGTYVTGLVPVISAGDLIAQAQLPENSDLAAAYSEAGISLSKVNYNLGFLILQVDSGPAISAFLNSNSGLANALSGSISKRIASRPASNPYQTYIIYVNLVDNEGLGYSYAYPLRAEYMGFG